MEDRQKQIQVGAGLQESRLNADLIQFLQKYGTPILMVVLVIVLGYVGWSKYNRWQAERRDEAFAAYQAARGGVGADGTLAGSPDNLLKVAEERRGRGAVWEL
ncbi:MAG TPA: tetratricopeptide repeat protein, partial [Phycisphaerales bacterium]|nr:tetratricopeptide repeat protein [Phycisphaerales bacterium]